MLGLIKQIMLAMYVRQAMLKRKNAMAALAELHTCK